MRQVYGRNARCIVSMQSRHETMRELPSAPGRRHALEYPRHRIQPICAFIRDNGGATWLFIAHLPYGADRSPPSALSKRVNKIWRCSAHNRICPKSNWHLLAQRVLRLRNADLSPGAQNCARSLLRFVRLVHQKRVVVGMRLGQAQRRHYQRVLMVVLVVALAVTHVHKAVRAIEPLRDLV